jgi:hypothetical protein
MLWTMFVVPLVVAIAVVLIRVMQGQRITA